MCLASLWCALSLVQVKSTQLLVDARTAWLDVVVVEPFEPLPPTGPGDRVARKDTRGVGGERPA